MKRMLPVAILLLCLSLASAAADNSTVQTFKGEISDTQCALNVHSTSGSHAEMLKKQTMGTDAASCARYCVKNMGGDFVLVSGKTVYRLDSDSKAEPFAAQKVVIRGVLDKKTNTITVASIEKDAKAK